MFNNDGIKMAVVGVDNKLKHSLDADMKKAVIMIMELLRLSAE